MSIHPLMVARGLCLLALAIASLWGSTGVPTLVAGSEVLAVAQVSDAPTHSDEAVIYAYTHLKDRPKDSPGFYFFRIVWVGPSDILKTLDAMRTKHPELDCQVVDPYTFFALFQENHERQRK